MKIGKDNKARHQDRHGLRRSLTRLSRSDELRVAHLLRGEQRPLFGTLSLLFRPTVCGRVTLIAAVAGEPVPVACSCTSVAFSLLLRTFAITFRAPSTIALSQLPITHFAVTQPRPLHRSS